MAEPKMAQAENIKEKIARRVAQEMRDGFYANLGVGTPTLVANYIPEGMEVVLEAENGMLGIGPSPFEGEEDPDLINAGKETVTELPGIVLFFKRGLVWHDPRRSCGPDRAGRDGGR